VPKAPHLVAALAHGIGAFLGQVAVDAKSNEIPAVRDLLKTFASLAGAVITTDALCGRPHNASYAGMVVMPTCVGTCRRSACELSARSA
jgi:predicted transposase YbfD/YdcC